MPPEPKDYEAPEADAAERVLFRFLRELPRLPAAADLGIATSAVEPWPHQLRVIRRVVERFPQSFLFADEVGLGKTVQAALALRCLVLSGRVERCLILVPKALLRQWQEELHEKAALAFARLDGELFLDVRGREMEPGQEDANPWNRHRLILASTQLARVPVRRRQILEARPWDLVIVDEAHHARRRRGDGPFRPNRLLELLGGAEAESGLPQGELPGAPAEARPGERPRGEGLRHRSRALYLLTATPMQIDPVEVWDLLRLLGLGGRWGADERAFTAYFEELRKPFEERDWDLLLELAGEAARRPAPDFDPRQPPSPEAQQRIDAWLRRATPIGDFVWRHTRPLLRRYRDEGLLDAGVPERRPKNVWVELSPRQRRLYRRIEAYLSEFYQRYEARRSGLGFVMTVYRRRLTSSFAAVRASLERRRDYLLGRGAVPELDGEQAGDEGEEAEESFFGAIDGRQHSLRLDGAAELPAPSLFSRDELAHLDEILAELDALDEGEPKLARLDADLRRFLRRRDRVLVFTQYLDTLDQLRDELSRRHRVACYSGRGGETLQRGRWQGAEKEALKDAFAAGEIEVLLCTEAASEGLNLQTCGVLINYDMPWNPMRVEQRIGRIDRIGQVHERIWIRNYFYADTVEATIYRRLGDRIDAFRTVLGELQPILHGVGEAMQRLALAPAGRRRRQLQEAMLDLRRRFDDLPPDPLPPSELRKDDESGGRGDDDLAEAAVAAPVTPEELEEVFRGSMSLGHLFTETGDAGVFELESDGRPRRVSFDPRLYAEKPYSLELLTWGTPLFERLLAEVDEPTSGGEPVGLGLYTSRNPAPVSVFAAPDGERIEAVSDLGRLRRLFAAPPGRWSGALEGEAASLFSRRRRQVLRGLQDVEAGRRRAEKRALRAEAGELLVRAASLELIAARSPGLFDEPIAYDWGPAAVEAQGARGGPYTQLLDIAESGLEAKVDSPQAEALRGRSPDQLARRALEVERRGWQLIEQWRALLDADDAARRVVTDLSAGLLERLYFPLGGGGNEDSPYVEPPELEPFRNAVPLLGDLADAAATLEDALSEGRHPLDEIAARPQQHVWIRWQGRFAAAPELFAAEVSGRALEPKIPAGSRVLLRVDPSPPRDGQLVLLGGVDDPETGAGAVLREWRLEKRRGRPPRLRLEALAPDVPPIFVDEESEHELRVLARWVDVAD